MASINIHVRSGNQSDRSDWDSRRAASQRSNQTRQQALPAPGQSLAATLASCQRLFESLGLGHRFPDEARPFGSYTPANDGLDDMDAERPLVLVLENAPSWDSPSDELAALAGSAAQTNPACTAAGDSGFDSEALASLLAPQAGDSGIFEVEMPGGFKLGVVVHAQPDAVSFLLSCPAVAINGRLRQQRTELEGKVERRIRRNVRITVL